MILTVRNLLIVALLSTLSGSLAWAQAVNDGAQLDNHTCSWITACKGINTLCTGSPTKVQDCYYCTDPQNQKNCTDAAPNTCQNTIWGPINACGNRYDGTCAGGIPCQGPFTANGWCPKKMCYNLP